MAQYKRILLKLSGEALMGEDSYGINHAVMQHIVAEINEIKQLGVELAIVVGGGNIFRGMQSTNDGIERVTADHMGMLATVMNALALRDAIKQSGLVARVQSALNIEQISHNAVCTRVNVAISVDNKITYRNSSTNVTV